MSDRAIAQRAFAMGMNPAQAISDFQDSLVQAAVAPLTAFQAPQKQSQAVPLTDNSGNVVIGANGKPAVIPDGFDVRGVERAGKRDLTLTIALPNEGEIATDLDLARFRRGGNWDLQRLSGGFDSRYVDSATILIGIYAASAGISRDRILGIENDVARNSKYAAGTVMDSQYTHLPERKC